MTVWLCVSRSGSLDRDGQAHGCVLTHSSLVFCLRDSRCASAMVLPAATTFNEVSIYLLSQLSVFQSSSLDQDHQRPCAWTAAGSLLNVSASEMVSFLFFFFFPVLKTTFIEYLFCVKLCAKCCKLVSSFSLCKIWGNTTAVFTILQIKNWGSEKLVHLSKATQLWRDRVRFTPRQVLQSLCSQLWVP